MNRTFIPKLFTVYKKGYSRDQFSKDMISGIIVGIVALPLAIAFAIASGVSPEKGLITAIIAGLIVSVFGGSRTQIGGPTGAFIIIVYVPTIDATGLHNLKEIIHRLKSSGTKVILSGVQPDVFNVLEKARVVFMVGKKNITKDIRGAMELVKGDNGIYKPVRFDPAD